MELFEVVYFQIFLLFSNKIKFPCCYHMEKPPHFNTAFLTEVQQIPVWT